MNTNVAAPLKSLDEWEEDVLLRYPEPKMETTEIQKDK